MNSTKKINLFAFEAIFFLTVATWSATSQQQAHPGGADNPNYTWLAWLTPDSYSNGVWTNLIQGGGSAGNFTAQSATAPPKINSGYNFHPSLNFPAGNTYWLKSANSLTIADTDNITAIFVLKRSTVLDQYNYLLAFSSVSDATDGMGIGWRSHTWGGVATQDISWKWRNTDNTYHFTGKPVTEGIAVIDNAKDASAGGLTLYLNGENPTSSIKATPLEAISDQPIGIASEKNTGDPSWHYRGTLQEIILLKANGTNNRIEPVDLQKIHSYLAIKYGFTLNNSQDYINSAGQSVWDRAANTDYRNYITGIARDDASGLYQKQSKNRNAASLLTVFVGSSVAALNSSNGGQLPDGVYAIFGSNNGDINTVENLSSEIPVAPGSTLTVNYLKGLKYKAQLTGATTQKVKLKFDTGRMGGALPEYVVVSRTSAFLPDPYVTKVFPLSGSTAEIELTDGYDGNGYNFIAFGGHRIGATEGPGGVSANLKLWLRADDAASIVTELLAVNSANKLNGYPDAVANALVPAVSEWKDLERNQTYSYTDGGNANDHMRSVYQPSNYMTNYHPAVRFWSSSSNSSYLGNASVTMFGPGTNNNGKKYPTNGKHSAFFVVNNNFNTHEWIYAMMFGSATSSSYRGPGYGVARIGSSPSYNLVGRFRTSLEEGNGTKDLFKQGATSILGYHHWWPTFSNGSPSGTSSVKFRFNGLEDTRTSISDGLIGMNQGSMLGKGYTDNRTILGVMAEVILYDDGLPTDRLELIESYLALKYGVTLTPGTAAERFDYKFSDGGMLWNGTAGGTKWETWYNRVAAVIRDDASGLHNRQSHSTNVGSILLMGVAGSRLGENNADLGNFANDREAVIWGDNGKNDNPVAIDLDPNGCGDFNHVFKRNWLIHKKTEGDRPIRMLVGAQNNSTNRLGNDAGTTNLFNKLTPGYSVYMIVADSAEKLDPDNPAKYGQFTAVVPMEFIDSVQQCSYTFTDTITYITFGYRPKQTSCTETVQFEGVKTFNWAQWVRQNYGLSVRGAGITKDTPVDLGDGIEVLSTNVTYSSDLTAPAWYPSVTNSPVAGSLYLQRKNGVLDDSKITVTINLNTPVRPEFSIYDIDGYYGRYEKITVSGSCNVGGVSPTLSYAGDPAAAYYEISGNMATATVRKNLSPTDKNGQLNVSFSEGVTQIVITYAITNQIQVTTTHNLIISPIRFRQVPPPPPINEDGLSFTKEVGQRDISTCEPVEYSFYLGNVNCESKPVTFRDTLPHGMKWTGEINWNLFDPIDLTKISYQGDTILQITDLDVPGADVLRVTATAVIDDGEVPPETTRQFNNHAWIEYVQILNDNPEPRILQSVDRETPTSQETWFNAIGGQRQDTVRSAITTNVSKYSADSTVTVTLTVTNPAGNDPVPSSYLDVTFDAGFEYIDGSFASNVTEAVIASSSGNGQLSIAGLADGSEGFEIPDGESTYTFELKAPALSGLVKEVDGSGVPTGEISPLQIEYIFTSGTTDPCVILGMIDVSGYCELPYKELIANHDHASTLTGIEVVIPVLKNDSIPATCTLEYEITTEPLHGDADFTNDSIRYQSDVDFAGYDTLVYRLVCDEDTSYAYVYIYVAEKPGNVTDVNCFIDLPAQVFTIRQNRYSDEIVANTSTPMVGDLLDADGNPGQDGVPEVIAMAYAGSYSGPGIHIFNNDLTLHHTINIDFTGLGLSDPYAIADVNNDSIG
ncbi:MAG: hypothetical protein LBL42_00955, partial [Tannerella sp.]|nr:hypothetical protein [Tannerella sp.]